MKLCILDGNAVNPGDLSWDALAAFGTLTVYPRTSDTEVVKHIGDSEAVFTNKTVLSRAVLEQCPQVRYIGVLATGYNVVDLAYARERGIVVTNIPAYSTDGVAQHTFALLLELCVKVGHHATTVRDGKWSACPDFCYWDYPILLLKGKTMGVVGFGSIGQAVAKIAQAFGMRVLVYSRTEKPEWISDTLRFVSFGELLRASDVITLHCPLNEQTRLLINESALEKVKPGAFLINTARGAVVSESAVALALKKGILGGFACDVLSEEPPSSDHPLLVAPNCIITPHLAWASVECRLRLLEIAAENVRAYLKGTPQNTVM